MEVGQDKDPYELDYSLQNDKLLSVIVGGSTNMHKW